MAGAISAESLTVKHELLRPCGCSMSPFPWVDGLTALVPHWLLARHQPPFLPCGSSPMTSSKPAESWIPRQSENLLKSNNRNGAPSTLRYSAWLGASDPQEVTYTGHE